VDSGSEATLLKTGNFEMFTSVTMKNAVFWMLRRVALVRTGISEERSVLPLLVTANMFLVRWLFSP
jgi:hypothetical protein